MRIIPVIDLRGGLAVRGRSGERDRYHPVQSRLTDTRAGDLSDPRALLRAYRTLLRPDRVYVADLDRIAGRNDNDTLLLELVASTLETSFLWDGGLSCAAAAGRTCPSGRIVPILGTETLRSIDDLRSARRPTTVPPPILSLDLRATGVVSRSALLAPLDEREILRSAHREGIRTVILLLLDRIGTATGLPVERLRSLRREVPDLEMLAGGGVASIDDLRRLRDEGFAGALLATALHEGLVTPGDLEREGFLG